MLKFEDNKAYMYGSGEQLLEEYAKLTNALKSAIIEADDEKDEEYADYLVFIAFKAGLEASETKPKKAMKVEIKDPWMDAIDKLMDTIDGKEKKDGRSKN